MDLFLLGRRGGQSRLKASGFGVCSGLLGLYFFVGFGFFGLGARSPKSSPLPWLLCKLWRSLRLLFQPFKDLRAGSGFGAEVLFCVEVGLRSQSQQLPG